MKKIVFVAIIFLLVASTVRATDTAVRSMSLPTWATDDESLTYTQFPQLLPDFSNRFVLEYGGIGVRSYLNANLLGGTALIGVNMPFQGNVVTGNNQFMVGYGLKSSLGKIGVAFSFGPNLDSWNSLSTDVPKSKGGDNTYWSRGAYQLIVGLSTKSFIPLDVGLMISYPYNTISEATQVDPANGKELHYVIERRSGFGIHLDGRGRLSNNLLVGAGVGLEYTGYDKNVKNWTPPAYDLLTETEDTISDYSIIFGAGGAYKWEPAKGIVIRPALLGQLILNFYNEENYVYISHVTRSTTTPEDRWGITFHLTAFLGGEARLYKSWKFRAGISKTFFNVNYQKKQSLDENDKVTSAESETTLNSNAVAFTTGIGGKIGFVNIDFLLNTNFFLNGPYLLSGVPSTFATQLAFSIVW